MSDSNVIKLAQPGTFTDSLTEILRNGAGAPLTQAFEAEVAEFLAKACATAVFRNARDHDRHRAGRRSTFRKKNGCGWG